MEDLEDRLFHSHDILIEGETPDVVIVNSVVPEIENDTACKSVAVTVPTSIAPSSTTKLKKM